MKDEGPSRTDLESEVHPGPAPDVRSAADGGPLPPRKRERYERLGEHARGGLGRVSKALDRELGRTVAIKEMVSPLAQAKRRFMREATITMRLEHPSIVPVHDAGRWEDGEPFYAMKLVSGRTLKDAVLEKTTLVERMSLLPNVIAVADAIVYAHDQGVIHRDLKASNVLVGAFGETIVIDWGLAKDLTRPDDVSDLLAGPYRRSAELTVHGAVVGTPSFMPPEQARGDEVDERADIYALGALVYFALSGKPPHEGARSDEVLERVRTSGPPALMEVVPAVPADLAAIVEKAMAREAGDRYESAADLVADLKRFQAGQMVAAHDYSWSELALRWIRRHRTIALAALVFVVLGAGGLGAVAVREAGLRRAAEIERDRADRQTVVLLEQQGRAELLAGRPFRASVLLSEAFRKEPSSLALRSLLTQAMRPLSIFERQLAGHTHDVPDVSYSPDGSLLVTASTDATARIWSADTGEVIQVLKHDKGIDSAEFSPDGLRVVTASFDRTIRIWDVATGAQLAKFDDVDPYRASFTPDGCCVVAGSHTGEIRIRDAETGAMISESRPHRDRIRQIVFSPDNRRMAVASFDHKASIWDTSTFELLVMIEDHESEVSGIAFSHDGRFLLTAESDVYMHVRDAATGARTRRRASSS